MKHDSGTLVLDNELDHFVVFSLDERRFALPLSDVGRIVRVVEMTALPEAPEIVLGVINIQGHVVPVINLRKQFGLPEREINLSDQFIIVHTPEWTAALLVDAVTDVIGRSRKQLTTTREILPGLGGSIAGVVKLEDDIILICNLAHFLSLEEREMLNNTMEENE